MEFCSKSTQSSVLHFDTEKGWRGGERQLALLVEGLRDLGVRSTVLAPPQSAIAQALAPHCDVIAHPMSGMINILQLVKSLATWMTSGRFTLVHTHSGRAHSLALAAKRLAGAQTPLIVHRRVDYLPGSMPWSRWKYHSPLVNHFVCVSHAIASILQSQGIDPLKVSVVHSATAPQAFKDLDKATERAALAAKFGFNPAVPWICNASALTDQKGYPHLLLALHELDQVGVSYQCIIAGEGPLRKNLERQAAELGLGSRVAFLGFIRQVPQLLGAADILAVPSLFEGLGTIIQDGIHAGCAIAAAEVGGIPEMIKHGESGLLSPPGNSLLLAQNLKELCTSAELRQRLSEQAKQYLATHFSVENMVKGNLAIYEKLCFP